MDWKNEAVVAVLVTLVTDTVDAELLARAEDRTKSPREFWQWMQLAQKWKTQTADGKFASRLSTAPRALRDNLTVTGAGHALHKCVYELEDPEMAWQWGEHAAELLGRDFKDPSVAAQAYVDVRLVLESVCTRLK